MNAIMGMTDLVLESQLDDQQREYLDIVKTSSGHLLSLINDILDLSKIEAGKVDLEHSDFFLRSSLAEIITAQAQRARAKGLELICQVRSEVTDALVGDAGLFRQVLLNLIGNAIKFSDEGEILVQVGLAERTDQEVILKVSIIDSGIGISSEEVAHIFEAFAQADVSTTRKYGGTGLGLTISRQIVEMMGGQIWVESEPGHGSTFVFTARLSLNPHASKPQVHAPVLQLCQFNDTPKEASAILKILVVEDNFVNQKLAKALLERRGHQVSLASTGRQALEILYRETFDLILMDVETPEMDGVEATASIRQREGDQGVHIPIIALTAHALKGDRERFVAAGMDDYLTTPLDAADLDKVLKSWCRSK